MKSIFASLIFAAICSPLYASEVDEKKVYLCRYVEQPPYGVTSWSQAGMVKNKEGGDSRFVPYNSEAAKGLILDATADRGVENSATATPATQETTFYAVYNDKGISLYIQAGEPLIQDLLDSVVDPTSPARKEAYEIFFAPGLHQVPYYQIMTRPFTGETSFFDWGIPHRHYRSLKTFVKTESLPLESGFGTFVFIPWESLYEQVPSGDNDYWRFSIVRWMPFGKAGGVTWGGKVHDTGNFGLLQFEKPTAEQKLAIEKRLLRIAWFKYLANAKVAANYWSDPKIGDVEFYNTSLKPVIDHYTALGESLGQPETWTAETVAKAAPARGDWFEFDYRVSELREEYLRIKRFNE